jgi:PilZ domain
MADAELISLQSGKRIQGVTSNISIGGCYVQSSEPFPPGETIQLILRFEGRMLQCNAMVTHMCPGIGMGLSFPKFNALGWLTQPGRQPKNQGSEESMSKSR